MDGKGHGKMKMWVIMARQTEDEGVNVNGHRKEREM